MDNRYYDSVIKEMKPSFAALSVTDAYFSNPTNPEQAGLAKPKRDGYGFFCNVCHEPYAYGTSFKDDPCSNGDCQGKLVACGYAGLWCDVRSYVWTFHDLTGFVNQPLSDSNAIWMFSGVKNYETPALMAAAGNDYSSFTGATGNGCWKVVDGALTWANA